MQLIENNDMLMQKEMLITCIKKHLIKCLCNSQKIIICKCKKDAYNMHKKAFNKVLMQLIENYNMKMQKRCL